MTQQKLNLPQLTASRMAEPRERSPEDWTQRSGDLGRSVSRLRCYRVMRSRLEPVKKVARMLRANKPLLLNSFQANGEIAAEVVEG
jgi:hypothetical protein